MGGRLGFYVARTKEVMGLAEEIKDNGNSQSIDELIILNLSIGRVSILALSSGDSLLAASVANQLHFFSISALLHKVKAIAFILYSHYGIVLISVLMLLM